ncbi:hypothetical protein LBMAG49_03100 [Planctomycetota bacterium]|nr:preprotein translocase subunit SecE [Planctomycetota bacterium]MSR38116.1 preprotein translocase subunit SecE [Planctomycetota bacterium]GDY00981.1 hypothetical protein LBMAG49_03100 [Planctomycetota bacterium]
MSYRKDQGRYARMLAFWSLVFIVIYGCFHGGGLVTLLDGWLGEKNTVFIDPFPLIGALKVSTSLAMAAVLIVGWLVNRVLNRPKIADALIDTEAEMHKVTWPTWSEAWAGTLAVGTMVLVLFFFLTSIDLVLVKVMQSLWGGGS